MSLKVLIELSPDEVKKDLKENGIKTKKSYKSNFEKLLTFNMENLPYDEQIVASSKYLLEYIDMDRKELRKEVKKRDGKSKKRYDNISFLVFNDEEANILSLLDKRHKTDPKLILKFIILFPIEFAEAYQSFSKFSTRNRSLILMQMIERRIPIGPVKSAWNWKKEGYLIKQGEKGIGSISPFMPKNKGKGKGKKKNTPKGPFFVFRKTLFSQSQTEADDEDIEIIKPEFSIKKLRKELELKRGTKKYKTLLTAAKEKTANRKIAKFVAFILMISLGYEVENPYTYIDYIDQDDSDEFRKSLASILSITDSILKKKRT